MTIRNRIAYGYALVLGVACVGTTLGIVVGNHYQQQALNFMQEATAKRNFLSDLRVGILSNRPAKQLTPYLDDPTQFETESQAFLDRIAQVEDLLQAQNATYMDLKPDHAAMSDDDDHIDHYHLYEQLVDYQRIVTQFQTRTQSFIQAVNDVGQTPETRDITESMVLSLAQSSEFVSYVEFADQLLPFVAQVDVQAQAAEKALQRAERLRIQVILASLALSMAIAAAIALYTSRTLAQPLQEVTTVARQVIDHNNFDLQVPVKHQDEAGILAKAFNQLIQQVKQLLNQLHQKNDDLEQALAQLNQQQAQLMQVEKMSSLGQLVAGVAHEINNPANFIHGNLIHVDDYVQELMGFVQLYQEHYPDPVAEIAAEAEALDIEFIQQDLPRLLASMKSGTMRIREIVISLRNFSRIDEAELKDVNIHDGLDSTLAMLRHRLESNLDYPGIQLVRDYGDLPSVDCFAGQLNQVFMNLLINAIDVLEAHDAQRSLEEMKAHPSQITIRTSVIDTKWVEIAIADNGPGIPEEIQGRVFDPFFTTKPIGKGTGMGLSISYQIITQLHGGTLKYLSTPIQGTEFMIQIPIHQPGL